MRRTKEEAEQTRIRIMTCGLELFAENGVLATSLVDIAKKAGVTRGAIYWHFKDKWELYEGIWRYFIEPIKLRAAPSRDINENDPLGKLAELIQYVLHRVETETTFRQLFVMYIRETADNEVLQHMNSFFEDIRQDKILTLKNAVDKGQLPADLDYAASAILIRAMVDGLVLSWLQTPNDFSLSGRAAQFSQSIIMMLKAGIPDCRPAP